MIEPPKSPFYYPDEIKVWNNRDFTNLNYKQIRTGQDKVNSQEKIEAFLDRSKSKVDKENNQWHSVN